MKTNLKHQNPFGLITYPEDIRSSLSATGFARFDGNRFHIGEDARPALGALIESFDDLPADADDPSGLRYRRYGRFVYLPWADSLSEIPAVSSPEGRPVVEYFQPISLNSTDGGKRRPFTPLHPAIQRNMVLNELIRFDYWSLPVPESWSGLPVLVGVHQIRLSPECNRPSVATPDHLHRDGEPFTYVHLMHRENVTGGLSYVANPECAGTHPDHVGDGNILSTFTLENPLDSFVVDDCRVSHHVGEVSKVANAAGKAERSVLLVDFTPMMPQFV
ncbi:MAG TPA: 2OG-Fe dioxygenase family protein [Afifellaceae bacterium]|nr:2OG-Fe dioxygenase family protein [Afifellaceae bacterium]